MTDRDKRAARRLAADRPLKYTEALRYVRSARNGGVLPPSCRSQRKRACW